MPKKKPKSKLPPPACKHGLNPNFCAFCLALKEELTKLAKKIKLIPSPGLAG